MSRIIRIFYLYVEAVAKNITKKLLKNLFRNFLKVSSKNEKFVCGNYSSYVRYSLILRNGHDFRNQRIRKHNEIHNTVFEFKRIARSQSDDICIYIFSVSILMGTNHSLKRSYYLINSKSKPRPAINARLSTYIFVKTEEVIPKFDNNGMQLFITRVLTT